MVKMVKFWTLGYEQKGGNQVPILRKNRQALLFLFSLPTANRVVVHPAGPQRKR
jgi:hypothetical protein